QPPPPLLRLSFGLLGQSLLAKALLLCLSSRHQLNLKRQSKAALSGLISTDRREFRSSVRESSGRIDGQEKGHQDRARHAPMADGVDDKEFEVGEVDAEAEADGSKQKAAEPPEVARGQCCGQDQHIA